MEFKMKKIKKLFSTLAIISIIPLFSIYLPTHVIADEGAKVFKKCKACHNFKKNKIGPNLKGVVDRKAASATGFRYSKALKTAAKNGLVWNESELDSFLLKPKKYLKGTRMSFGGIKKKKQRLAVINYMRDQ